MRMMETCTCQQAEPAITTLTAALAGTDQHNGSAKDGLDR